MLYVPIELGVLHQAGGVTVLTTLLYVLHTLRLPPLAAVAALWVASKIGCDQFRLGSCLPLGQLVGEQKRKGVMRARQIVHTIFISAKKIISQPWEISMVEHHPGATISWHSSRFQVEEPPWYFIIPWPLVYLCFMVYVTSSEFSLHTLTLLASLQNFGKTCRKSKLV